jgi:hypothetical protein
MVPYTNNTACLANPNMNVGFMADKIAMAGQGIEGFSQMLYWAGDLFTKYGWSGGLLSVFGFSAGRVVQMRGGGAELTNLATERLRETVKALGIGGGLVGVGSVTGAIGKGLSSRATQCKIADTLNWGWLSTFSKKD